eukprot:TRINITY_DN6786_c1_g1_i1.p1 TRINITY_DN6786_c1_g1~~TRINITY_DN6786_c1_g1_i1.p1  ORF type:complete len:1717 (-),score=357.88 TRINITY_DN6786_c1_g1_i1:78-5066(-)
MEGDTIGALFTRKKDGTCKFSFSLNGSFDAPFGQAFEIDFPVGTAFYLVVAAGDEGNLAINLGQNLFQVYPPVEEGYAVPKGLGEAMQLLPAWKVTLPKGVKAWPVFEAASRESKGKKPLEDKAEVEQLQAGEGVWVELIEGWVQTKTAVAGREIEALSQQPLWSRIDPPRKSRSRKGAKLKVNATYDVEFCEKHSWRFEDNNMVAMCESGPSLLTSAESGSSGILQWMLHFEDSSDAFEVGVIPAREVENSYYLHQTGKCGMRNTDCDGGEHKPAWSMNNKFVHVLCDIEKNKVTFSVGEKKESIQEVKVIDLPYNEEVKLAVTGWNETRVRLEAPDKKKGSGDSDSDSDMNLEEEEIFATSCGNAVQQNTWHMATICVDLEHRREMTVYLDGEPHLRARDPDLFYADGPFSIDTSEGVVLFGRRRAGKMLEKAWRQGGHLRQMRMSIGLLDVPEVWSLQMPKGVWGCRTCNFRNAADVRVCWQCLSAKPKSAMRPPNDADPRHEGLMVVVADSFKELVLESKEHIFIMVHAPWCEACQDVKSHILRLAKMLKGSNEIRIAMIDSDENDVNKRFFPEPFIPNMKLFMKAKKGTPLTCNTEKTFEAYSRFIEEHTNITVAEAVDDFYPAYCVEKEVTDLAEELRLAAMTNDLRLMESRLPPLNAVASFLYTYLFDPEYYKSGSAMMVGSVDVSLEQMPSLMRLSSTSSVAGGIGSGSLRPSLSRQCSATQAPAPSLSRAVSTPLEQAEDPLKLEEELKRRHLTNLLDVRMHEELKKTLPDKPREFLRSFFLKEGTPTFSHSTFYNARTGVSWRRAPHARKLVAMTRILRRIRRWVRSELGRRFGKKAFQDGRKQRAEARITCMTAAAMRSNWRRVEEAICRAPAGHTAGISSLQILLERGFDANGAPFGITPTLLAALVGNLQAVQFLFVRGASVHALGGVQKDQQLTPIDAAAANGFLRIVHLLAENGSCTARALHFAVSGGHEDICRYLLRARRVSPDLRADNGLSALTLAVIGGQCNVASMLLPHCTQAMLEEGLPGAVCYHAGLAGGSTILHLVARLGGTREALIKALVEKCPVLINRANWSQEIPAALASPMMRPALQPRALAAFEALGAMSQESSVEALKEIALAEVLAEAPQTDSGKECCIVCLCEGSEEDPLVCLRGCGHFFHREECLGRWRAEGLNGATCPACRAPLPEPVARAETGGPTFLELAALADDVKAAEKLLLAGAKQELIVKGSAITPLMWAHWRDSKEVITLFTTKGGQLSNGDLEGLQRLRDLRRRNEPSVVEATVPAPAPGSSSGARGGEKDKDASMQAEKEAAAAAQASIRLESVEDGDKPDADALGLLDISADLVWRSLGRSKHADAIKEFGVRMAECALPVMINSHDAKREKIEDPRPNAREFLDATEAILADVAPCKREAMVEAAKLFAIRSVAQGRSTSMQSAIALRLFLSSASTDGLHSRVGECFLALNSSAPLSEDMERLTPFTTQLELALKGLPSKRGTQFIGMNMSTPSGKLTEVLNGSKGIGSYHPGGMVLWCGCGSVTSDPMIAKEIAMKGSGVAVVFKIRSVTSRCVASFSTAPDLNERLFLPRIRFRVAGIYPLEDMLLRKGLAASSGLHSCLEAFQTPEIGGANSYGGPLSWEDACNRRSVCVVLDEEV